MIRSIWVLSLAALLLSCQPEPEEVRARNVILFIGDGVGIPTLNAASVYGYGAPQQLFLQQMPNIGLSDTSAADTWVTDSAAGMTAIITGHKTNNGVIAQAEDAVRGSADGKILKTLLEYAEEKGLATGVVSNSSMADATPAACYAHCNDRSKAGEIFAQVLKPSFGDGVDVVIGPGREGILAGTGALGIDLESGLEAAGYRFVSSQAEMEVASKSGDRVIALYGRNEAWDLNVSARSALDILIRKPEGFFLMVESNNHSTDVRDTLEGTVRMDRIIRETAERMKDTETLIIFTADHSYDLRLPRGPRVADIVEFVVVEGSHTAEEVLVAAQGPGSEQVRGMFPNTRLFEIIKNAYGW